MQALNETPRTTTPRATIAQALNSATTTAYRPPPATTTRRYSISEIVGAGHYELSAMAAECGIAFSKVLQLWRGGAATFKRGIEREKAYRGKVMVIISIEIDKAGREYPRFTFTTRKHGGITATFTGWQTAKDLEERDQPAHQHRQQPPTAPAHHQADEPPAIEQPPVEFYFTDQQPPHQADQPAPDRFTPFHEKEWQTLPPVTSSPYLTRKGFDSVDPALIELRAGSDYRGGFICFQLRNVAGQVVGYQKIYDQPFGDPGSQRDKDFIFKRIDADSTHKRGSFLILGDLSKADTVYHVEGLSTGLSVEAATTGAAVIVCLDAGNLQPAIEATAELTEGKQRIIAADNDTGGNGNAGLYAATRAQRYNQDVTTTYPIMPDGSKGDFNDLERIAGLEAVAEQLEQNTLSKKKPAIDYQFQLLGFAPYQQFNRIQWAIAYGAVPAITEGKLSVDEIAERVTEIITRAGFTPGKNKIIQPMAAINTAMAQQLRATSSAQTITDTSGIDEINITGMSRAKVAALLIDQGGVIIDDRGMGAGKTKLMIEVAGKWHEAGKLGSMYTAHRVALIEGVAQELGFDNYQDAVPGWIEGGLAVCVNSMFKWHIKDGVKLLLIDEFRQTIEHIFNGTVDNRYQVMLAFTAAIQAADLVICADADFNDQAVNFLKQFSQGAKITRLVDSEPKQNNKKIEVLKSHDVAINDARTRLAAGDNVFISCDSANQAEKAHKAIVEAIGTEQALLLTGENKADEKQAAFLTDPTTEATNYRAVIHSPVISSGVSITCDHFDIAFGLFSNVVPPNEMAQQIGRCRAVDHIKVSFRRNYNRDRNTDKGHQLEGEQIKRGRFGGGDYDQFDSDRIDAQLSQNEANNNYIVEFLTLAKIKGYSVTTAAEPETKPAKIASVKPEKIAAIHAADHIDGAEFSRLDKQSATTQAESDSMHLYRVFGMASSEEPTPFDVEFYIDGGLSKLTNYEIIQADKAELIQADKANEATRDKQKSGASLQHIFNDLLDLIGDSELNPERIKIVMDLLKHHSAELTANGFGNFNRRFKSPTRALSDLLKKIGYRLMVARTIRGCRLYRVAVMDEIKHYAALRAAKKAEACKAMIDNEKEGACCADGFVSTITGNMHPDSNMHPEMVAV